jgi:hypothetical protein
MRPTTIDDVKSPAAAAAGGVGPGRRGATALNPVDEAPNEPPGPVVASPGMAGSHRNDAGKQPASRSHRQPPGSGRALWVRWSAPSHELVVNTPNRGGIFSIARRVSFHARPSIALATHAFRDEIVLLGLRVRRPVSDVQAFRRINAEVDAALDFYGRRGWLNTPTRFFAKPHRWPTLPCGR